MNEQRLGTNIPAGYTAVKQGKSIAYTGTSEQEDGTTKQVSYDFNYFTLVRGEQKIGRNDKCPCGSGKKYKLCCLNKQVPEAVI